MKLEDVLKLNGKELYEKVENMKRLGKLTNQQSIVIYKTWIDNNPRDDLVESFNKVFGS